jgi:pimeloyl-ACP methyl ester carboxylesterase
MFCNSSSRSPWLAGSLIVIFSMFVGILPAHAHTLASMYSSNGVPVIYIHGFNNNQQITCNDSTDFGTIRSYLSSHGWTGPLISVGYYSGDNSCDYNLHNENAHCAGFYDSNLATINEDLRHLSCLLAWYIWDAYTQRGVAVKIISHSMGGIIARQALFDTPYMTQLPPYIMVEDVVTAGTPHQGLPDASAWAMCSSCSQVAQMEYNNPLMANINSSSFRGGFGNDPQGNTGTDWTTMASENDEVLNAFFGSADRGLMNNATHKVKYLNPGAYNHGGYLVDASDSVTAHDSISNNAGANWTTTTTFTHSIKTMFNAIQSQSS